MTWKRLMSFFAPVQSCRPSRDIDALFADTMASQRRVATGAAQVTRAADIQRRRVEAARVEIKKSTDATLTSRPSPRTSDVRDQVNALLAQARVRMDRNGH